MLVVAVGCSCRHGALQAPPPVPDRAQAAPVAPAEVAGPPVPLGPPGPPAEALVARAGQLRTEGDTAGARATLEAALAEAPDTRDARIDLAALLAAEGRELDRAGALLAGIPGGERDPRWLRVAAELAEVRGDDAGAVARYGKLLTFGEDPQVRVRRALALERLGRPYEALFDLERVRKLTPDDALVRVRLAERYEADGRLAEAEAELEALARTTPERPQGWARLAAFYRRSGRPDDARRAEARAEAVVGYARPERVLRPLRPTGR